MLPLEEFALGAGIGAAAVIGLLELYDYLRARSERAGWDGRVPLPVWAIDPPPSDAGTTFRPGVVGTGDDPTSRPARLASGAPYFEVVPPPRVPPRPDGAIRLSQRLVVHLYGLGRVGTDDIGLPAATQRGIGDALGAEQSAVSKVLRRLVAAGVLEVGRRHVRGGDRRVNVYSLTHHGELIAREIRSRAASAGASRPPPIGAADPHPLEPVVIERRPVSVHRGSPDPPPGNR